MLVASTKPAIPTEADTPPWTLVDAARTTKSSGTNPTHASHHQDGAGKATAGSAPAASAAAWARTDVR